jgi:hypothetical protein
MAIALLMGCAAGLWRFAILPLATGFLERQDARIRLLAAYARNDRMIAGLPAWRLEAEQQARTASAFAIVAPTMAVGNEALRQRMAQAVRAAGGTVLSTQMRQTDLPANWIGVQSDLKLTLSQLTAVLARFQNEEPYVVVDFLSVALNQERQPGGPESLMVRLAISAPLRINSPPPESRTAPGHA